MELRGLLVDTLALLKIRSDNSGVRLALAPGAELSLFADREQLKQVFVNLALNALDAMPSGGDLTLRVRRIGARAQVEVADTGPGIATAMLPRLFEPFASGKDTGLGLGLVISKRIVEDHGGTIGAANRVGGGASFYIALPIHETGSSNG